MISVKGGGEWIPLGVAVDDRRGVVISMGILKDETAALLEGWLRGLAETVGAEAPVTDDADGFKRVADVLRLKHQVCRVPVTRNTLRIIGELAAQAQEAPDPVPARVAKTGEISWSIWRWWKR